RGERVRVKDYLERHPQLRSDPEAFHALLYHELLLRERHGESPQPDEYLQHYPDQAERIRLLFQLRRDPAVRNVLAQLETCGHDTPSWPGPRPPPAAVPPPADTVLLDRFEVVRELGHGAMGVVYEARDRRRREVVALKRMLRVDANALARFRQEFRALADLPPHPNLVSLHELFCDAGTWFFTMEYVEGIPFLDHVRLGVLLPEAPTIPEGPPRDPAGAPAASPPAAAAPADYPRLREAFRQAAGGVAALHRAGRLHRDLKPANVLVSRQGRVVLLDFGLAAELNAQGLHESTEPHLAGTVPYMSPEQAASRPLTPA